jgi:hypothetical protein
LAVLGLLGCGSPQTRWLDGAGATGGADAAPGADAAADAACNAAPIAPPASLGLSSFYTKYIDANGIPVLSSPKAASAALGQACSIVVHMLAARDDVRQALIASGVRVAVIAQGEVTTDLPEYHDLNTAFPGTNWDSIRGVSATNARPVSSSGEENLLCLAGDPNQGQSMLTFTFAVSMELGIDRVSSGFQAQLASAYASAMSAGLWAGTFSITSTDAYWGDGVQAWFDANNTTSPPDGGHNAVDTRAQLQAYDPALAALIASYLPGDAWRPGCP